MSSYAYNEMAEAVIEWVVSHGHSDRIVSLDLETKVLAANGFLSNETVLSIAFARRVGGRGVCNIQTLNDEHIGSEEVVFNLANQFVGDVRPLIVVGYNITGYDIPLLQMKLRALPQPFWALKDMVERAFILDLMHPLKFELASFDGTCIKLRGLEEVLNHERFSGLSLIKAKALLRGASKEEKGAKIYEMWRDRKDDFEQYAKGDVADVLTIFEDLYLKPFKSCVTS